MSRFARARRPAQKAPRASARRAAPEVPLQGDDRHAGLLQLQHDAGNQAVTSLLGGPRAAAPDHPPPFPVDVPALEDRLRESPGRPLPADVLAGLRADREADLSRVRVHDDTTAAHLAISLGADAFALGEHIVLGHSGHGGHGVDTLPPARARGLIAHEAQHVAAGSGPGGSFGAQPVQLSVSVDDVSGEMVGRAFVLRSTQGTPPDQIPKGARVLVTDWHDTNERATVRFVAKGAAVTLDVPKLELEPDTTPVSGVRRYTVGLDAQRRAVSRGSQRLAEHEHTIAEWQAQKPKYKRNPAAWGAEQKRLQAEEVRQVGLQAGRETVLSRMLVRQTMYNRFDPLIRKWVNHYNAALKPDVPLDPNVVKSILFQESRMGVEGEHLGLPPYDWAASGPPGPTNPIKSRFNVMQAIDSWGPQQLLMIKEMAPALYARYKLADLEKEMAKSSMSNQQMAAWNGAAFSRAVREFHDVDAAGKNQLGDTGPLYEDYDFWIRTGVRWLFEKYQALPKAKRGWAEAVRAFNGSGPKARGYSKSVMSRVGKPDDLDVGTQ
jgi:hypothetical protein